MQGSGKTAAILVSAKEASRLLAVSPRKLWTMTFEEEPGLTHVRCGRGIRYAVADLERWVNAHRKGGNDAK